MIDHLVYATSDLATTVDVLNRKLGVELTPGGQHVGLGTRNFLAGLGNGAYLEVIGPDLGQPERAEPRPFAVDGPRLVTWAVRVNGLADAIDRARAAGYDAGPAQPMSRRREDGVLLEWRLTGAGFGLGVVPFLIDWGTSPHPSDSAVGGLELVSLTGTHPEPDRIASALAALGVDLPVTEGEPGLRAVIRSPAGEVVLT